jgi:uncharacterized OB-fold protein
MTLPQFPLPQPTHDDRPYWEALRRHELVIQECKECKVLQHPPCPMCPACHSLNRGWRKVSGRGVVYSYTIPHQAVHPAWADKVPYNVVLVELQEDVRVVSNLVDCPDDRITIGMPVEIVFDDVAEDVTLARFRPAR